jgi:hypothetical protein
VRVAARLHHIGVGRTYTGTRVLIIIQDLNIKIIHATTASAVWRRCVAASPNARKGLEVLACAHTAGSITTDNTTAAHTRDRSNVTLLPVQANSGAQRLDADVEGGFQVAEVAGG